MPRRKRKTPKSQSPSSPASADRLENLLDPVHDLLENNQPFQALEVLERIPRRYQHCTLANFTAYNESLQRAVAQSIDAGIAHMEEMCRGGLDDHGAEGADIAFVVIVGESATPGLGMQPGIGGEYHALRRGLYRPGLGGAIVVGDKSRDGSLAGHVTDFAAADAVGQRHGDPLGTQLRLIGDANGIKILIGLLAAFIRILPDGYL